MISTRRFSARPASLVLLAIFSGIALSLAAVGIYGVISYSVAQSKRELGLRMALGADGPRLLRMVIGRGLRLTGGGILLGAAAGFALTRLLGNLLFNVSPHDPVAFGSALAAMRINPTQVLRN